MAILQHCQLKNECAEARQAWTCSECCREVPRRVRIETRWYGACAYQKYASAIRSSLSSRFGLNSESES